MLCRCAHVYKRHSKSIDTDRMACSLCSGRLMFRGKFQADGTPARARGPNAFSDFVREHFAGVKAAHPAGLSQQLGFASQCCTCTGFPKLLLLACSVACKAYVIS